MKRIISTFIKSAPLWSRKIVLFTSLYIIHSNTSMFNQIFCISSSDKLKINIVSIEDKTIKIKAKGRIIGEAYCFSDNYLVAVAP